MHVHCIRAFAAVAGLAMATAAHADALARLIVKFKDTTAKSALTPKARIAKLASDTGVSLAHLRSMALGAEVVTVEGPAAAAQVAALLVANPDVDYAVVDHRVHAMQFARSPVNDQYAQEQRYLANGPTAISAYDAWTITHGSPNIVVAVIDTGYRPHAGMLGRFLPGYDMISDVAAANDGEESRMSCPTTTSCPAAPTSSTKAAPIAATTSSVRSDPTRPRTS